MIVENVHSIKMKSRMDDIMSPLSRSIICIYLMMRDGAWRSQGSIFRVSNVLQSLHPYGVSHCNLRDIISPNGSFGQNICLWRTLSYEKRSVPCLRTI